MRTVFAKYVYFSAQKCACVLVSFKFLFMVRDSKRSRSVRKTEYSVSVGLPLIWPVRTSLKQKRHAMPLATYTCQSLVCDSTPQPPVYPISNVNTLHLNVITFQLRNSCVCRDCCHLNSVMCVKSSNPFTPCGIHEELPGIAVSTYPPDLVP